MRQFCTFILHFRAAHHPFGKKMIQGVVLLLLVSLSLRDCRSVKNLGELEIFNDPDTFRNVSELITSKGYPLEEHVVQTADGFLLSIQRIPHGRNNRFKGDKKQAVFVQHGLLSTASDWVINFPEQSLGFILADAGYDVWLGNTRGNSYSRRHVKYTPRMREFWDYSFDEMGAYDLPAMIDHVLNVTGEEKIYYIGHSQGTTQAFALLSESPKYNEKIKLFIAMAPVTTVGYITSAISYIAPFTNDLDFITKVFGVNEFLPDNAFMKMLSELVCDTEERFLCKDIIFVLFGADKYQLNQTRMGVYAVQLIGGSSTKSVVHYGQLVNSKVFAKFDYRKGNMDHYNQSTPPEYDVSRITTPVALVWGMNDKLADPVDVDILKQRLKSLVSDYCVPFPLFNHGDFVLAMDANKLVYDHVLSLLATYH